MSNDFQSGSRSGYRAKRKKTNLILNSLIVIVLALIFFVAYTIFLSGDDKASQNEEQTKSAANEASEKEDKNTEDKTAVKESEKNTNSEKNTDSEESADEEREEASSPEQEDESQAVITEGDGSSNILRTIENPAWKPVGTVQTGEHAPVYDSSSVDWQEMLTAISYATGLEESNMTVYWLGRDKTSGNGTFSTVASKDKSQKYNVYLEWVDGQGWKPTKVEELTAIQ
ncbi:YrrS family protein [Neobacillus sp. 179-J 1A1 HS]|uniref:YrrS family protein n=1 Tax=Neobacillus driksii TaxID=3035913 RepID=UPI0035BC6474